MAAAWSLDPDAILAAMTVAQLVLGTLSLVVGAGLILGRDQIAQRHRRRGSSQTGAAVLWVFLGALLATNGLLQIALAMA